MSRVLKSLWPGGFLEASLGRDGTFDYFEPVYSVVETWTSLGRLF
jgi:hypothetical protein